MRVEHDVMTYIDEKINESTQFVCDETGWKWIQTS